MQPLTFSLVGGPTGASIIVTSGVFSWTPAEAQGPGDYTFTVRVGDGVTNTDQLVTLHVTEVNVSPVLTGVPLSATISELSAYTFDADATDGDVPVQTLTFSLADGPSGAAINASTGVFGWTPTEAQGPGDYTFTVRVTDGVANSDQAVTLHVSEVNVSPSLTGVPTAATIAEAQACSFTAAATDADVPVQTLTFSLVGGPSGAAINVSTGVFGWTPTEAQGPGDYTFTVRVSDGVANTDQLMTLHVGEVNVSPVLTGVPLSATISELSTYTFDADATDADVPLQSLTFLLVSGPTGAAIDTSTGVFDWTPSEVQGPGDYTFTVRVSDAVANTDQLVTLHVGEVNVSPVLAGVPTTATISELSTYTFDADATDADVPLQPLTFSLVSGPSGAVIDSSTGVFGWTPTEAQGPGDYTFTMRVSDEVANTDQLVTLHVGEVNVSPVLAGVPATATISELSSYTFDADATDADVPVQSLTFSLVGGPTGASMTATNGVFSWTPTEAQGPGDYTFTVRVGDGVANTDQTVVLHVTDFNVAPLMTGVPVSATTPELVAYMFDADATDADLPAQPLTFSLENGPAGGDDRRHQRRIHLDPHRVARSGVLHVHGASERRRDEHGPASDAARERGQRVSGAGGGSHHSDDLGAFVVHVRRRRDGR